MAAVVCRASAFIFLLALLVPRLTAGTDDFARCEPSGEPCGAAGHMTMKGWHLTGAPVAEVCAPVPRHCRRPCGVHFHYFKLAAGLTMGKGLLAPLFPVTNTSWVETYSLAHAETAAKLAAARRLRWPTLTVLRDPMERLLAQFFATAESVGEYDALEKWVELHSRPPPRRGNDGATKLWFELDNAFVKVLSGHDGRRVAAAEAARRGDPPPTRKEMAALAAAPLADPEASLAAAQRALAASFDLALVAEWLVAPSVGALLGDALCFGHDRGIVAVTPRGDAVPDLSRVRRRRNTDRRGQKLNHEGLRAAVRSNATWWAAAQPSLRELARRNALDARLFAFAANRLRTQVTAHWQRRYPGEAMPPLPPLPCGDGGERGQAGYATGRSTGAFCWERGVPGKDLATLK